MRAVCWSIFFLTDSHYSAFVLSRSPSPALPVNKTKTGVSHSTLAWFIAEKWKDANFRGGEGASAEKRRQKTHCTTARAADDGIILLPSAARREMRCDGCIRTRVKVELYKTIKAELLTSAIICLRTKVPFIWRRGFLKVSRRETHSMLAHRRRQGANAHYLLSCYTRQKNSIHKRFWRCCNETDGGSAALTMVTYAAPHCSHRK
jgi:hypothetical protein